MKFDHILFPTDFSDHSEVVKAQVEMLARRFGSRVTVMHVFEIPASWCMAGEASFSNVPCLSELISEAKQRLDEYPIALPENQTERVLAEGNPAGHITEWVANHDVDLIMMGSHGYGKLQGVLIGSVTAKVMHDAACPVWTDSKLRSQDESAGRIRTIVCALELDSEAVPVLRFAGDLADNFCASVRLMHSVPALRKTPDKYFDFDLDRYLMDSARVEIAKLQRKAGTDFPVSIEGTAISDAIAEVAGTWDADLVVIGRGKAQGMMGQLRTHAYEIIRRAPCPVLSYAASELDRACSVCTAEYAGSCARTGQLLTTLPIS